MAAEAAAADADDGGFEVFAEAPLTASADADAATTPAEADDPSFTAFEEAPAETDAAPSDEGSDWLDEMPDAGFVEQSGYVCDQMCTNPKFLDALLKYM